MERTTAKNRKILKVGTTGANVLGAGKGARGRTTRVKRRKGKKKGGNDGGSRYLFTQKRMRRGQTRGF